MLLSCCAAPERPADLPPPTRPDLGLPVADMSAPDLGPPAPPAPPPFAPDLQKIRAVQRRDPRGVVFTSGCAPGERLIIAAVGDVLLHKNLQWAATVKKKAYRHLWAPVEPHLRRAHLTYANLEGVVAPGVHKDGHLTHDPGLRYDAQVYTSWPRFNYPPRLLDDLKAAGVDVVSTANNHALDRYQLGVDLTLEELARRDIAATGTRHSDHRALEHPRHKRLAHPWYAITRHGGWRIALLACAHNTNGIPDRDDQVLSCGHDRAEIFHTVRELAADRAIDAVIVTPHWGVEYLHRPLAADRAFGRALIDAGAHAVLGAHPHVVQPWEVHTTATGRQGLIAYSLGNFISGMGSLSRQTPGTLSKRATIILYLGLTRDARGDVSVNGARYMPAIMRAPDGWRQLFLTEHVKHRDGAAAEALLQKLLGAHNRLRADEALTTSPECAPNAAAPSR